jgi:dephospho-CoA kinase
MLIGLTGGIGSGKSLAGDFFKSKNIDVIDADDLAQNALDREGEGYKKFLDIFGETFLDENSEIDRKALRKYIFQNPEMKNKLEEIVHPIVQNGILNFINNSNSIYRIIIVPLIAETNSSSFYDRVLAIDCKKEIQIERASKRDNSNEEQILKIIQSQASSEDRNKIANDVVENNDTKDEFLMNLEDIHKKYLILANND